MKTSTLVVLVSLVSAGAAFAQDASEEAVPVPVPVPAPLTPEPEVTPVPVPVPVAEPTYVSPTAPTFFAQPKIYSQIGVGVLIGGAVNAYFGDAAKTDTVPGAGWQARIELGTRSHLGGEFGYVGSTNRITALGVDPRGQLMSNGAQGLMRLNILTGPIQPYAGVGLGVKRYQVVNTVENTSDITDHQDLPSIPAAFGLAMRGMGLIFDARFAVDAPISASMIPGSAMTSWNVGGNIGAEF